MIGSKIIENAYILSNTNSGNFLDANATKILERLNTLYGLRVLDIIKLAVDKNATMQKATTDLISTVGLSSGNNGYNGEYAFPSNLLRPVRLEVSFDGITWKKARVYDQAENVLTEYKDEDIDDIFSTENPRVDFFRNSFRIRPVKNTSGNITNGIYIEYEKRQADFTADTAPSEIEENLQGILAYDLAELEYIMHADKHQKVQYERFLVGKGGMQNKFDDFYKNQFKGNKRVTVSYPSYK